MKTVFNDADRSSLYERLDGLTLECKPLWTDDVRPDAGPPDGWCADDARRIGLTAEAGPLRFGPIRHAVIHWLPFRKGAPMAPELLVRCAEDSAAEIAEIKAAMDRMAKRAVARKWEEHPAFGPMTEHDWNVLVYRHTDHHLRQFGA